LYKQPPKETNKALVTDHIEMKVYKFTEKEFKLIIFKFIERIQRNKQNQENNV
jgi:hypothetical protein